MRKIDETQITGSDGAYFKKGTWTHLQKAYIEALDALAKAIIKDYDPTKVYILYGCENSTTAPIYTLSAGAVYYAGEVYLVDAVTFTSAGADVAVATIVTTNNTADYSADPVISSLGNNLYMHNIRKIVIATGTAGTGISDYSNFIANNNAHIDAYEDITASVTLNTAVWAGGFTDHIVKRWEDGTVSVNCTLQHAATVSAGTGILTGLPVGSDGGIQVELLVDDFAGTATFHHCTLQMNTGALVLRTAIGTTNKQANISFTYKV